MKALEEAQAAGGDPRKTKALFAAELIERLHSREAADRAAAEFAQVYAADAVPDDVPRTPCRRRGRRSGLRARS